MKIESVEPKHKLTTSEKEKTEYGRRVTEYYAKQRIQSSARHSEYQALYDAVDGVIDKKSYDYVTNRYHSTNERFKRFPAKLRNYNIIEPVIKSWLGENTKKPQGGTVIATESDSENKRKDFIAREVRTIMYQDFINHLNELGFDTKQQSKEIEDYQSKVDKVNVSFDDLQAIVGQEILDYLKYDLDLIDVNQRLLYDWIVTGCAITYKDIYLNEVTYTVKDPRTITVIGMGKSQFIEDADAVLCVNRLTTNNIIDSYQDEINNHKDKEAIIEWLDSDGKNSEYFHNAHNMKTENFDPIKNLQPDGNIEATYDVTNVAWKSLKKIGILYYINELGMEQQLEVDDSYKLNKKQGDIKIEWIWISEVWEGTQIEDKWFLGARPIEVQRNRMNNASSAKLPYNGRIAGFRSSDVRSPVKQGVVYNIIYNILHYRWELLLAKNKDKILAIPSSLIPSSNGMTTEAFMHFMAADGTMIYDDSGIKAAQMISGVKQIDMSTGQYMDKMYSLMTQVRNEWWDTVGMNRQRFGETLASDGKANNEQAIARSSIITAEMFRQFDSLIEKDLNGILDYSKVAYIDGKKAAYITSDKKQALLNITSEDMLNFINSDVGVFVKNTTDELEKIEKAKQLLLTLNQNGLGADKLLEVLDANNMSKIITLAKEGEAIKREYEQQQQQAANESNEKIEQLKAENLKSKNDTDIEVANIKAKSAYDVALINSDASLLDVLNNKDGIENEQTKGVIDDAMTRMQERQITQKAEAETIKHQAQRESNQLTRDKMINDLKIAKENKN